jgi:hypothetical protein
VPQAGLQLDAQAVVIGEVKVPKPDSPTQDEWEWRYALFKLRDLERIFAKTVQDIANGKSGADLLHPLDDPEKLEREFSVEYYGQFGPGAQLLLSDSEKEDLLSSNDLAPEMRNALLDTINPPIEAPGILLSPTKVSRLNFAIPLRDVVRVVFYDKDRQPFGRDLDSDGGPLTVLDTCRIVNPPSVDPKDYNTVSSPGPRRNEDWRGSRVILFADPMRVDAENPKPESARGKLFGFAVLPEIRLALNGHSDHVSINKYSGLEHGHFRFFAIRAQSKTPAQASSETRQDLQLFSSDESTSLGPFMDSMRIGYSVANNLPRKYGKTIRDKCVGELTKPETHIYEDPKIPTIVYAVPIIDQINFGITPEAVRSMGFRLLDNNDPRKSYVRMALRFEAVYQTANSDVAGNPKFGTDFTPPSITQAINSGNGWLRFAQEQRQADINWQFNPAQSLHWLFTVRHYESDNNTDAAITKAVIDSLDAKIDSVHLGLTLTEDATPVSLLPRLELTGDHPDHWAPAWNFVGYLYDNKPYDRVIRVDTSLVRREIDAKFFTLEPRFVFDMFQVGEGKPYGVLATARFPRFVPTSKPSSNFAPAYQVLISAPLFADPSEKNPADSVSSPGYQPAMSGRDPSKARRGVYVGIKLQKWDDPAWVENFDPSNIRIGSLELKLDKSFPKDVASTGGAADGLVRLFALKAGLADNDFVNVGIDALIKVPLSGVVPGGQDDLPTDAQITTEERIEDALRDPGPDPDASIVLALADPSALSSRLTLYANETVARRRNHTLELSIKAIQEESADSKTSPAAAGAGAVAASGQPVPTPRSSSGRLLVIDPAPFRVAVVKTRDLAAAQSNESDEIAVWNAAGGEGLSWRIVDDKSTVSLLLPPQVIGEGMEKDRDGDPGRPPDISEGKPAPARFGTLTRLDLDPSYFDTRYVEPGWNLRRVMGYPGQRAPGAGLRDLRLELMYGITTRLSPSGPGIRVAEIGAAVGAPADSVPELEEPAPRVRAYVNSFNAMRTGLNRRLAVDRLWRGNPLDDLTIEQDARFELRIRLPQSGFGPLTPFRWPVPGGVPVDLDGSLKDTFSDDSNDAQSFPGGVPWAFESSNILRSVYRRLESDGGRARNVHLSALGGWGNQRGLFDQKKTAIETETTMGRVHRYALERIGRIGALWHRAKHVIVYERTVSPSAQFYNIGPIGLQQDALLGRPVLRKVEEYVELLQQVRRYPEQGNAIEAAGCLVGAEFLSRRIRVDSRWGGDVRAEGWQVPLWNKIFDIPPKDPNNPDDPAFVYPKPQIRFLVMGEGNVEKAVEIAEPEKLVFYTSIIPTETGDNTDAWHPVRDIDFVDLPLPQAGKRQNTLTEDLHDGLLPPEPPHVAGYERFTIGIVPSKDTISIMHGRQDKGPVALLRNITVGRSGKVATTPKSAGTPTEADVVSQAAESIAGFRVDFDRITGQLSEAARVAAMAKGATRATVKDAVQNAATAINLPTKLTALTEDNLKKWKDPSQVPSLKKKLCDEQVDRIGAEIESQFNRAINRVDGLYDEIEETLTAEIDEIQAVISNLNSQVTNAKSEAKDFIRGLLVRVNDLVGSIDRSLEQAKANFDGISEQVSSGIDAIAEAFVDQLQSVNAALQTVLGDITPLPNNVTHDLAAAMTLIPPVRANIGPLIADAASNSMPQTTRTVLLVLDKTLADTEAGIVKAKSDWGQIPAANFETEIKDLTIAISSFITKLQERVDLGSAAANSLISNVQSALDGVAKSAVDDVGILFAPIQATLASLLNQIDTLPVDSIAGQLDRLGKNISGITTKLRQDFTSAKATLKKNVDAAKGALTTKASGVCAAIEGVIDSAYETLSGAQDWIDNQLASYQAQLDHALDQIADDAAQLAQTAQDAITQAGRQMEARVRETLGGIQQRAADYLNGRDPTQAVTQAWTQATNTYQQGSDTLRLFRALGDPPKTDQLGFNRPEVAYVFQEANKIVDMTPTISLVNRVADTAAAAGAAAKSANDLLTSFGIRLPASAIGDQLMPDALKDLDVSKLFPDFSGIKLDGLFKNLGFPSLTDSDAIKVRHGFDRTELSAWLEADIDVPFSSSAPLMEFGPVQIIVDQARFTSSARLSEGRAGTQKTMHGKMSGDWRVVCAGQTILTFVQTDLTFDQSGRINFNIQPDRVVLADALQFLTDLIEDTGEDGDFQVVPFMSGGVPTGVAAQLDMVLPPIQTGVFGISDLSLHILFGVSALPEFEIVTELAVGAKLAPFTLNVWILNGGGFLTTRLAYLPTHSPAPLLSFTLEVGIVVGVGLGFSFGVVSGGVYVQVGCAIAITWMTGPGGSTTTITVFLLIRGCVDVAGLVTVGLSLLLAISYDGSKMIASGTLSLSIKISMFFTLSVSEHVEYDFAGGKTKSTSQSYSQSYA